MTIWTPTDTASGAADVRASVCVIGAGLAGLTVVNRLIQSGKRVVAIESGGVAATSEERQQELNEIDSPSRPYMSAISGRSRALGGSSTVWGGRFLPLTAFEVAARPHVNLSAWPLDISAVERYRTAVEDLFDLSHSPYGDDARDDLPHGGLSPRSDGDFAVRFPKWTAFKRRNLGKTLEPRLRAARNLDLWTEATVCDFEFDDDFRRLRKVIAEDSRGRRFSVAADEFVLAAGTVESTRLLLVIGRVSGGQAFGPCQVLGSYLQDHLGAKVADLDMRDRRVANHMFGYRFEGSTRRNVHLELTPSAQVAEKTGGAFAHVIMAASQDSSTGVLRQWLQGRQMGLHGLTARDGLRVLRDSGSVMVGAKWRLLDKQHYWPPDLRQHMFVWTEQLPDARNRIALSDRVDRFGVPLARIDWRPMESDERTFRAAIRRLASYWHRHHLEGVCRLRWAPEARDETHPIAATAAELAHPSGTTRMGRDPRLSVVDPDLRCHLVRNLTVVSASVFPSAGSTGPTCTLLQVAMRSADQLIARIR